MFGKKICGRCGKSAKEKYDFCPYCGNPLQKKSEDWGMLGRHDFEPGLGNANLRGNSGKGFGGLNMLFNSLMRNLEKQLREEDKKSSAPGAPNGQNNGISISISTFGNGMPMMANNQTKNNAEKEKKREELKKFFFNNFNSEKLKKYSSLPKEEPKTNVKRIYNKVFYEVEMPGVKSAKDVSIVNLEKSIELKAVSEKKAYKKIIPMNFPISDYKLLKGKLVLEMDAQGN